MALRSWVSRDPLVATRKLVVSAAAAALLLLRQPSFHHQSQAYATAPDHTQGRINNNGQDYLLGTLPQTMRAAVFWEPGKPMTIEDLKLPRPQFGEVLVKTKACGVCHSDLHVINKDQPYPIPCVLGHEITGEVVEHGAHTDPATVHRLPVGSRVVGSFIMPCGGCFFCVKVYSSSELFPLLYLTICHHLQSSLKYYKSSSCFQDQLNALMPLSENGACPYCIDLPAIAHAIV
jgi:hypothetical protein